jgi:hypothetical protein
MSEVLPPEVLSGVLAMIGPDPSTEPYWFLRLRVIQRIGSKPGGDWWKSDDLAHWLQCSSHVRRVLVDLEKLRIIERQQGGGSREHFIALNPNVTEWRGVPWVVTPAELRARLKVLHAEWLESLEIGPFERFAARLESARQQRIAARHRTRGTGARQGSNVVDFPTGNTSPEQVDVDKAAKPSRVTPRVTRDNEHGAAPKPGGHAQQKRRRPSSSPTSAAKPESWSPPTGGDQEEEVRSRHPQTARLNKLICDQVAANRLALDPTDRKRPWLNGQPVDALDALVHRYGYDLLAALVPTAPVELGPPKVVEFLEVHAVGEDLAAVSWERLAELERQIASKLDLLASYQEHYDRMMADPDARAHFEKLGPEVRTMQNERDGIRLRLGTGNEGAATG